MNTNTRTTQNVFPSFIDSLANSQQPTARFLNRTCSYLCIVLFLLLNNNTLKSQTQLPNWYFFNPGSTGNNVRFGTGGPSLYSTLPVAKDEGGVALTDYKAVNAMYDDKGQLLFYIVITKGIGNERAYFYDENGTVLMDETGGYYYLNSVSTDSTFVFYTSREIPIISVGCARYHAVIGNHLMEINIATKKWKYVQHGSPGSNVVLQHINCQSSLLGKTDIFTVPLAIGRVTSSSYTIFNLAGNIPGYTGRYINSIEIDKATGNVIASYSYDISVLNIPSLYTTKFTGTIAELEISPDGSMLALADDEYAIVFNLDAGIPTINPTTPVNSYYRFQIGSGANEYRIAGLEFTSTSNQLVFNRYDVKIAATLTEEVGVWDFTTSSTPAYISSSSAYAHSQIELGKDGKIYTTSNSALVEISTTSTPSISTVVSVSIPTKNNDPGNATYDFTIRTMPDQIDGYSNGAYAFDITSYDVATSGTWTPGTGHNPFNSAGTMSVLNKITIKSGTNLTVKDFVFNFFTNAELVIEKGATLTMLHCYLQGHSCGVMWKGVKIEDDGSTGGGFLLSENLLLEPSLLKDAITGITLNGQNSYLYVYGYTYFTANENDVSITNGNSSNIQIFRTIFDGNNVLKDQTKGSNNGFSDMLNRTNTSIHLENCSSQIVIGHPTYQGCTFSYSQIAVEAIKSDAILVNDSFTQQKVVGIHADAWSESNKRVDILTNQFINLQQGIKLENGIKSTIQSNTINTTYEYGINYLNNPGCNLLIGDMNDISKANSLDNCNWAGINLFDNANDKTNITIGNNSISNHIYATGISVGEYSIPASGAASYANLSIFRNTIHHIGAGIKLYQVAGWNGNYLGIGPTPHNSNWDGRNLIDSNDITYTTELDPYAMGIQTTNSNKLNIIKNTVVTDNDADWRNVAILTDDALYSSIYKNSSTGGGAAVRIGGDMRLANVYCNYLTGIDGVLLNYAYLRGSGATHGIAGGSGESRDNAFTTSAYDIRLYYSNKDLNQWIFNIPPPSTKIDYTTATGTASSIVAGSAHDPCDETFLRKVESLNNQVGSSTSLTGAVSLGKKGILTASASIASSLTKVQQIKANVRDAKDSLSISKSGRNFAKDLAQIDDMLLTKNYHKANLIAISSTPKDSFEVELLTTYKILCNKLNNKNRKLRKGELDTLLYIAHKNQHTESAAASLARTVLKQELHIDIYDVLDDFPEINGNVGANCIGTNVSGLNVKLLTHNNIETGFTALTDALGNFKFNTKLLANLNAHSLFKFKCTLPDSTILYSDSKKIGEFTLMSNLKLQCPAILAKKGDEDKKNIANVSNIKVYPNPNAGIFTIECGEQTQITIYNTLGEMVYANVHTLKSEINLNQLPKGLYILHANGINPKTVKLIIE